jgi:hypothetical protein
MKRCRRSAALMITKAGKVLIVHTGDGQGKSTLRSDWSTQPPAGA